MRYGDRQRRQINDRIRRVLNGETETLRSDNKGGEGLTDAEARAMAAEAAEAQQGILGGLAVRGTDNGDVGDASDARHIILQGLDEAPAGRKNGSEQMAWQHDPIIK